MKKQKRWILKLIVLLTITQLLHCPTVKYNNPTDGANGILMQLFDTLLTTFAGTNTSSPELKAVLTGNPSAITEGQTATVQIKLSKAITSNLVVTLTLDNPIMTIDTVATKEFTFTPDNATVEQSFTLAALTDANSISETVNLKISAAGLTDQSFSISTIDNTLEIVQTVIFTGLPSTITEGQTSIVQVKLAKEITSALTVVLILDNSAITVDGSSFKILNFPSGSGTVDQTIVLSAVSDTNSISETVNMKVSAVGLADKTFSVSTIDNTVEVAQALVFTGLPTTMTEGQSASVQVKLAKEVTSTVTVTVSIDSTAILVNGGSANVITFTSGTGTVNQLITLTAVPDTNSISETVNVKVTATGLIEQTFSISIIDNTSQPPVITVSNVPTSITEGQTGTVGIQLSGVVTENFIVTVTSGNTLAFTVSPSILIFTPANFSVVQKVTIAALQDANVVSESVVFTLTSTELSPVTFNVTSTDDDTQSLIVEKSLRILNGGSSSLAVILSYLPASDVTINFVSSNSSALTLGSTTSLTFSPSNYNQSQSITINCSNQTPMRYTVTASATGINSETINVYCLPSFTDRLIGLKRTGQFVSYATGDDGTHQKTMAISYIDNGDGTVTDGIGLIWQKCTGGQNIDSSCSGIPQPLDWATAGTYCSSLNLASKVWRLPTLKELAGLEDLNRTNFRTDTLMFPAIQLNYWTSTTYAPNILNAFYVHFGDNIIAFNSLKTTPNYYVRCVSGISSNDSSFVDNSNGTITDNTTKLVWQKCSYGQNATTCLGTATTSLWANAISYCNGLNLASKTWRLPNVNELHSIVDHTITNASGPTIDATVFPNTQPSIYWSSNTSASSIISAWVINFTVGSTFNFSTKTINNNYIRCVSGP